MKSKKALIVLTIVMFAVMIFNTVFEIKDAFFHNVEEVPTGTLTATYPSPNGSEKVNVYVVKNPLGSAVRCEAVSDGKTRNIYWEVGTDKATVAWLDKTVVYINGKTLDVYKSAYDSRDINEELDRHLEERYTVYQ